MLEILIRPRAREDLKAIWRYSLRQWGERQADLYLQQLDRGIRSLADFPDLGIPCDQIRAGYRKLQVNLDMARERLGTPATSRRMPTSPPWRWNAAMPGIPLITTSRASRGCVG